MNKINAKGILLFGILFLYNCLGLYSQSYLNIKPVVFNPADGQQLTSLCASSSFNSFNLRFFHDTNFGTGNVFTVQLSNKNGVFNDASDPPTDLKTISNRNNVNTVTEIINLPDPSVKVIAGEGYKLRILSSLPDPDGVISLESDAFAAYNGILSSAEIKINNGEDLVLCGNTPGLLTVNVTGDLTYRWYKDSTANQIAITTAPELSVTEAGLYLVEVIYGSCGGVFAQVGNLVKKVSGADAEIAGDPVVEICGGDAHTFSAQGGFVSGLTYTWFKDGNQVFTSTTTHQYTTPTTNQFGKYKLVASAGSCTGESSEVELKSKSGSSLSPEINGVNPINILLPNETREIEVTNIPTSGTISIQWYKDNNPTPNFQTKINVTTPGEYYAEVTDNSGSCSIVGESNRIVFIEAQSLSPEIRADNYTECESIETTLKIVGIGAKGVDGNDYSLTSDQIAIMQYQWYKGGAAITSANNEEYTVSSYLENDSYFLEVSTGARFKFNSDPALDIKLSILPEIESTQVSNSLCPNGSITYTIKDIIAGYTYEWRDTNGNVISLADPKELKVEEVGIYTLHYSGFGCDNQLDPIEVVPFDDSAVQVTPSEIIVVPAGQTVTATASGANSYEWYDEAGDLLSSTESLDINKLGVYTLVAKVDNCEITKTIEAVAEDGKVIVPNIVSPNQDGINDTWQIPNKYAFQPNVTVTIYNSNGKEILNTNEYKNNWPEEEIGKQRVFYYRIVRDEKIIKAGTISILD